VVVKAASPDAFPSLVRVLAAGGVAIAPGDTMYGLVGVAPDSGERIGEIKGRGEDKPFLRLLPDPSWVAKFSPLAAPASLLRYWPGPLTLVFPAHAGGTVALRVPDSQFLRELLEAVGSPLYSTSVNRAGTAPLQTVEEMRREFEDLVDLIYDAGDLPPGTPSTLVDVTSRPCKILRPGALLLSPEDLR
jgi:L-threonylcarbamoyladenylate synthase